jgi:hypothetical protein
MLQQDVFPAPRRVASARATFDSWRWQFEQPQVVPARPVSRLSKMVLLCIAGITVLVSATFVVLSRSQPVQEPHVVTTPPLAADPGGPRTEQAAPLVQAERIVSKPVSVKTRRADRAPLELDVHYRLHRIGACTAEPVLVARRGDGPIEVSAVGPPPQRERQIRAALRDLEQNGRIAISITPVDQESVLTEALGGASQKAVTQPTQAQSDFARRFGSPEEFTRIAGLVVQDTDILYSHAWALQKHAQLPDAQGAAAAPAYWLRDVMLQEHAEKIREVSAHLRRELAAVVPQPAVSTSVSEDDTFTAATKITALLHRLFGSEPATAVHSQEDDLREMRLLLDTLDGSLDRLDAQRSSSGPHVRRR